MYGEVRQIHRSLLSSAVSQCEYTPIYASYTFSHHCTLRPCISTCPYLIHSCISSATDWCCTSWSCCALVHLCTYTVCRHVDCWWIASRNLLCNYCGYALLHLAVRYFCADKMKMTLMLCATILFCLLHLSASQRELPGTLHTRVCTVSHDGEIFTLLANHW